MAAVSVRGGGGGEGGERWGGGGREGKGFLDVTGRVLERILGRDKRQLLKRSFCFGRGGLRSSLYEPPDCVDN
ncbi:hypothetical protein GWI33_003557 [Rhynchophorus ferrugineus]|uniref:Uncharacterized protein n=1 Tax=Rhynchophorus ferrugineus TaxID=354439 RepID=A0A834HK03_RHYFE|nr:hypothetical protein GWI33_003557 [Rhynchophorus ferrugineus]